MIRQLFGETLQLERTLDYQLERHNLITTNLSNAETPGYRPVDVTFEATLEGAGRHTALPRLTHPKHLGPTETVRPGVGMLFDDSTQVPGNDLNSVSLERESAKLSANTIRYETATEIVSRILAHLKYAAGDGGNA
jgi:flagellar basal-body rod protein FlgB